MYTQLVTLHHDPDSTRSPIVFVHGFPDSRLMFADYHTDAERQKPWLAGRSIYAIEFPNRHTNNDAFPSWREMAQEILHDEFKHHMDQLAARSQTGQIIPIAHDWGATFTWRYIRSGGHNHIERLVSLSVGSLHRYDIWEHGPRAFVWFYALLFSLPYYLPFDTVRKGIAGMIVNYAGYQSATAHDLYIDAYHYWDGPLWLYRIFYRLWIPRRSYVDFRFPVLYIRSPQDRIASNAAFEQALQTRDDCILRVWDDVNHWFPEQHSQRVLDEIRPFLIENR